MKNGTSIVMTLVLNDFPILPALTVATEINRILKKPVQVPYSGSTNQKMVSHYMTLGTYLIWCFKCKFCAHDELVAKEDAISIMHGQHIECCLYPGMAPGETLYLWIWKKPLVLRAAAFWRSQNLPASEPIVPAGIQNQLPSNSWRDILNLCSLYMAIEKVTPGGIGESYCFGSECLCWYNTGSWEQPRV